MSASCCATTSPPTLSLWPLRYFVVLCSTRSAPNSIGRWSAGLANVLSTTTDAPRPVRERRGGRQVGEAQHRVGRRLEEQHPRLRGERGVDQVEPPRVDVGEVQVVSPQHPLEQPERAAVGVVGHHDVVARLEARGDGADGGHAGGKREAGAPGLEGGDVGLERRARRVLRARVFVALVLAERILDVGRRLVDRRDDGAGGRVGLLPGVDAERGEVRGSVEFHVVTISLSLVVTDPSGEVVVVPRAAGFRRRAPRRSQPGSARARGNLAGPRRSHRRLGQACLARRSHRDRVDRDGWKSSGSLGTLALLIGLAYFLVRLISLARKHLLWRVRRKLILSYILVGSRAGAAHHHLRAGERADAVWQREPVHRHHARAHGGRAGAVSGTDVRDRAGTAQRRCRRRPRFSSASRRPWPRATPARRWPWCPSAARAPPPRPPRSPRRCVPRAWPAPGRGRTLSRRARFPRGSPAPALPGLSPTTSRGPRGAGAQTQLAIRAAVFADGATPRFAVVLDLPVDESHRRAHARGDRHRAARHLGDRSAAAAGARRRAAGGALDAAMRRSSDGCSRRGWRCSTSRTGRRDGRGRRRCRSG